MFDSLFCKRHLVLFSGFLLMSRSVLGISELRYEMFVRTSNQQLITSIQPNVVLQRRMVSNPIKCAFWCLRISLCLSFNFEKDESELQKNEMKCELLSVDGELRPDLVRESDTFDHYSITDLCQEFVCLNGGSCVILKSTYGCLCAVGYTGTHCEIQISECFQYKNLSEANRNIKHGRVTRRCDSSSVITSGKWYRFTGPAGSRMLDNCPKNRCDTDFQGWLERGQPGPGDVRVGGTVCFQGNGRCCNWRVAVKGTHCGTFVVYQLKPLNCNLRYCGSD